MIRIEDDFIKTVQKKAAISAIGPSALRNQGKDKFKEVQQYCYDLDLSAYSSIKEQKKINELLDSDTENLLKFSRLPWGTARKAPNLFLRDALYNTYLCKEYNLEKIEPFLEITLDSAVARGLKKKRYKKRTPSVVWIKSINKK